MSSTTRIPFTLTVVFGLALICGCSSSGRMEESERAVEGFAKTKASIAKATAQVDDLLKSLDALSSGGDLSKSFKQFNSRLDDLKESAEKAKNRAEAMRERQDEFIAKWQEEMTTVKDPTLKSTLEQRREAVRANYERVRAAGQAVRDAYDPFVAKLDEIQKTLSIDLTPPTVTGIRSVIDSARKDGQTLKDRLGALQAELDRIEAGLSPTGKAAS